MYEKLREWKKVMHAGIEPTNLRDPIVDPRNSKSFLVLQSLRNELSVGVGRFAAFPLVFLESEQYKKN